MRFRIFHTGHDESMTTPWEGAVKADEPDYLGWDGPVYRWFLDVPTLDALLTLVRATPECHIVLSSEPLDTVPSIEIYDDYRE